MLAVGCGAKKSGGWRFFFFQGSKMCQGKEGKMKRANFCFSSNPIQRVLWRTGWLRGGLTAGPGNRTGGIIA